jgi:FkbM family methyltransferase
MGFFRKTRPVRPQWDDVPTEDDIFYCYRLILKHDPDEAGFEHYRQQIAGGVSLDRIIRSFFNSEEYRFTQLDEWRPTPVDLGGYQVCIQKLDTDFGQAMLATGEYEPHVRRLVTEYVRPDDVVVDIGANVGAIALLAATLVKERGLVIAVEPNPDNVRMLHAGIVLNGFSNVRVIVGAASDRSSLVSLTGGISNTHVIAARHFQEGGGQYAQALVLDEWLTWLPRLDFVKMDIEGHEPQAFDGFRNLLTKHRPTLLVEFNPRCLVDLHQRSPRAFLDELFALYPHIRALSAYGDDEAFADAADLMAFWERRNRELRDSADLPDRLLHFDLLATIDTCRTGAV